MFIHDSSLSFIEVDESDVIELHRSTGPAAAAPEGLRPRPCNACVCAIRDKGMVRVYVLLEHADRRGGWVFTSPDSVPEGEAYHSLLRQGIDFAVSLGFSLHEVNLRYSKAMREVVIRDISMLRRPSSDREMEQAVSKEVPKKISPPSPSSASPVDGGTGEVKKEMAQKEKKGESHPPAQVGEVKQPPMGVEEAKVLAERLAAEKAAKEKESRERLAELTARIDRLVTEKKDQDAAFAAQEAALKGEVERLTSEKERAEREHAQSVEPLRSMVERLKKEMEALGGVSAAALSSLRDEIARLESEKERVGDETAREEERLRGELEQLAASRGNAERAAAERIDSLKTRLASLSTERERVSQDSATRIRELEAEAERLVAEKVDAERRAEADIAALEGTIALRTAEKEAARKLALGRLVRLAAEAEILAAEREAVERILSERGSGEMAVALARAEAEAATLRREVERLAAEKIMAEQTSTTRVTSLQAEVTRLAASGDAQGAPLEEQGNLSDAVPFLVAARVAESTGSPMAEEWDEDVTAAVEGAFAGEGVDPFGLMEGEEEFVTFGVPTPDGVSGAAGGFNLDGTRDVIEYGSPEEVIEVQSSLNVVNITPAGRTPQPCGAYIVVLKRGGRFLVHVAWSLKADHTSLVYSPGKQPDNADECASVVGDALAFVETVGFMMDGVRLNADREKRGRALAKIPVLRMRG